MNEEKILKIDREGKSHEAIIGVSIFKNRVDESGKNVRKVLLVQGPSGQWYFPGGKVREGENLEEALRRELREELQVGFTGVLRASGDDVGYYGFGGKDRAIANVVLDGVLDGEPTLREGEPVKAFKWTANPFAENLTEQVRAVLMKQMAPETES